jgi:hypothetical protein
MFIRKNNERISKFDSTINNENNINYYTNAPFAEADPSIALTFIKSTNVQAYPCGRRRSTNLAPLGNPEKRLPFDPEARLNTEANNRKHSGLNGYTQTYLKEWEAEKGSIDISLAGYLFSIKPYILNNENIIVNNKDYRTAEQFAKGVISGLGISDTPFITRIYANIVIEDVHLFSAPNIESYTGVLRKQDGISRLPTNEELDLLYVSTADNTSFDNYYFSGLSFSVAPLVNNTDTRKEEKILVKRADFDTIANQHLVSLCILEKVAGTWQVHEPARLPRIEHGVTEDSVVMGHTVTKNLAVTGNLAVDAGAGTGQGGNLSVAQDIKAGNNAYVVNKTTTKDLQVTNEAIINKADIVEADIETAHIEDLTGDNIQQKIGEGDDAPYYMVPVIFLEEQTKDDKTFYQLQISRVNDKN